MKLRVAFMGSPEFAVPSLRMLLERADVRLVVTQPDKPAGRGRRLTPPPVKEVALAARVPVAQPALLKQPPFADVLRPLDLDLAVVVAYGKILPAELLAVPRLGCWNIHASLLPRYRGAAPIQRALLAGEKTTGVTLMQMEPGMDTGPVLDTRAIDVGEEDTAGTLHEKLAALGAELLATGLDRLLASELVATPQDAAHATLAPKLEKEEGRVDWTAPAERVRDRIRAMDPWPGAFTLLDGEELKLWRAKAVAGNGAPGTILGADKDGLVVACGAGAIVVGELQLPGRKRLSAQALIAGRPIPRGTVLG